MSDDKSIGTNLRRAVRALRRSKYHAKPTVVDGIRFASMKEAKRYGELKLLEKAGEIEQLKLQPRFDLCVPFSAGGNAVIGSYVADFEYQTVIRGETVTVHRGDGWKRDFKCGVRGERVVEDVKGYKTPVYRLKKKMVEAQYGIQIREV